MAQVTQSVDPAHPAGPPSYAPARRPGLVTAAGVTLIVLGAFTALVGLVLVLGGAMLGGAANSAGGGTDVSGLSTMLGAAAGVAMVMALVAIGLGVLQVVSGIKVMSGRSWARIAGIVSAVIIGLVALAGIGDADNMVFSGIVAAACAFVIFALATTGSWFAARNA
jgi:hypothetical protein